MIYKLTENEFRFLLAFSGIPMLTPAEPAEPSLIEDTEGAVRSLTDKEYLLDEEGKYYLPEELNFFLDVVRDPFAIFCLRGSDKKMWAFFREDVIILILKDPEYQIIWIPFIHLLIGATAGFMEPFLNAETTDEKTYTGEDLEMVRETLTSGGLEKKFEAAVYRGTEPDTTAICEIYGNSEYQAMIHSEGDVLIVNEPCKMDMVNTLTKITAYLHADAMKAGISGKEETV